MFTSCLISKAQKGLLALHLLNFAHLVGGEPDSLSTGEEPSSDKKWDCELINMFSLLDALKLNKGMSSSPPSVFGAISISIFDQV